MKPKLPLLLLHFQLPFWTEFLLLGGCCLPKVGAQVHWIDLLLACFSIKQLPRPNFGGYGELAELPLAVRYLKLAVGAGGLLCHRYTRRHNFVVMALHVTFEFVPFVLVAVAVPLRIYPTSLPSCFGRYVPSLWFAAGC